MKPLSIALFLLVLGLSGCASMSPDYEEPSVALTSFKALPTEGMVPAFEVGLRIINPNSHDLHLEGIVYTISIEGHELMKGVGKDFPVIGAYTQEDVSLNASIQLLSGLRLASELMRADQSSMNYEFKAKLDLGGFYPSIRITESGEFDMGGGSPR